MDYTCACLVKGLAKCRRLVLDLADPIDALTGYIHLKTTCSHTCRVGDEPIEAFHRAIIPRNGDLDQKPARHEEAHTRTGSRNGCRSARL